MSRHEAVSTVATEWDWPQLHARCRREARRLLGDPHDAEDAAQEALARAWRKRHSCRTPAEPVPWLLQITRNEALRLIGRRREEPDPDVEARARRGGEGAVDELLARADVRRAISRLSREERLLLHLRYDRDLKQKGIAELLDTPEGTIKVRLYRARERLRADLAE